MHFMSVPPKFVHAAAMRNAVPPVVITPALKSLISSRHLPGYQLMMMCSHTQQKSGSAKLAIFLRCPELTTSPQLLPIAMLPRSLGLEGHRTLHQQETSKNQARSALQADRLLHWTY